MIIYGSRNFRFKRVGYASDFCESCKRPAIIEKLKWYSWFHIFWIPLIPLGHKNGWFCVLCRENADGKPKTPRSSKIIGAVFFGLIAYGLYALGAAEGFSGDLLLILAFFGVITTALIVWAIFPGSRHSKEKQAALIPPVDTNNCAFCGEDLVQEPSIRCESCDLDVLDRSADA